MSQTMGGSYQDQERLVRTLEKFQTFDARAEQQPTPGVLANAAGAMMDLLGAARVCGYSGDEHGLEPWAMRRVTRFLAETGRTMESVDAFANIAENARPFPLADGTFGIYARLPPFSTLTPVRACEAYVPWSGPIDVGAPVYWSEGAKSYNSTDGLLMPGWRVHELTPINHPGLCRVVVP